MADYMAARIQIGGKVPREAVESLCAEIDNAGMDTEFGEYGFKPRSAEDLLAVCEDVAGVRLLALCDDEAKYGEFAVLEELLREHKIPYTRRSYGKYEHEPCVVEYRPEEGLFEWPANGALEPVVVAADLAGVDASLLRVRSHLCNGRYARARETAVRTQQLLWMQLPPVLPPLPQFEIETDENPEATHGQ
jgi:hypothetical protein